MSLFRPKTQLKIMHRQRKDKKTIKRGGDLSFGSYGLKVLQSCEITEHQLEACRRAIQNSLKRAGKVICRIFPNSCKGSKPVESRMGKGAAKPDTFYIKVAPGTLIWEITGVSIEQAQKALLLAMVRLPATSKIIVDKNQYIT